MRFLIVDASPESGSRLAAMLRAHWPSAESEHWNPEERGDPRQALALRDYSAVLLDPHPGDDDGLDWIAQLRRDPGAPPVLLITDRDAERLAVKAIRAGAADFLRRTGLDSARLARSVEAALREQTAREATAVPPPPHLQTVRFDSGAIGVPAEDDAPPVPGYRIERLIGEGGMAQVYLAERELDGSQVVLKVLDASLREDVTFLRRFVREYKLIGSLESEHVATVYDQGITGRHPYFAMEYFPGGTLAVRIHEGVTSLGALRLASQIAKALDAIHSKDVVHRDLKPQNIMFRANGRPAIVDFGLARDLAADSTLTQHGELLATPRYASPEQCMGRPVDHRSDLYSLGVIFYEMLSGRKLYADQTPAGLIYMQVHGALPRLPARLAGYQPILDRLLAKRPEDRFHSARDLFAAIAI